jgi:hypothetical protein
MLIILQKFSRKLNLINLIRNHNRLRLVIKFIIKNLILLNKKIIQNLLILSKKWEIILCDQLNKIPN